MSNKLVASKLARYLRKRADQITRSQMREDGYQVDVG